MSYQVSRNGQLYGPYTLEDLQRYVATGNVLPTDLAHDVSQPEDPPNWVPVSQLLAASGAAIPTQPYIAPVAYAAPLGVYPDPPNLNWGLLLLFDILTCGFFQIVWNLILAAWAKRIEPISKALIFYIIATVFLLANFGSSFGNAFAVMHRQPVRPNYIGAITIVIAWIIRLIARYSLREDLERHYNGVEPVGLRIGPVLTFFFGGIYFQYKLNQVNEAKQTLRYRGTL
ncbi:DUF4339 domain-containing protein [Granulicella sp. dw_53]|uniref:DUF4339 domain-containing protein n=1 Tax=Granulicella sp. dw_53 TaxID=2719792 RepID=UPI001BD5C28B|nr:DUF4339 domain-containing protein [Granulicella sp. dw_53]